MSFALSIGMSTATHVLRHAHSRSAARSDTARRTRQVTAEGHTARVLLTTPVIYSLVLPLALLDLCVSLYQWICFPLLGIERVGHRGYFTIDRHRLTYLNVLEKMNCTYCSYANGVLAYTREVAARTETYWCPIKHARPVRDPHARYQAFVEFGDASGYRRRLPNLRRTVIQPASSARRAG